jgi:hypothetical protein
MDIGTPLSYQALQPHTPVYSKDGQQIGTVAHVLAVESEDVFDGIVIAEHLGTRHRFADADDVDRIGEQGVLLKLDDAACAQLPEPSANPGVMGEDPGDPVEGRGQHKLKRAWDLLSGNY